MKLWRILSAVINIATTVYLLLLDVEWYKAVVFVGVIAITNYLDGLTRDKR